MSQDRQILTYLKRGGSLTAIEALDRFGTLRLAARINDLRSEGHPITTEMRESGGKRFAIYRMGTK